MKRIGVALTWGLWAGLIASLAHALGGAAMPVGAWLAMPLAATGVFWISSFLPGRVWNRLLTLALFQWIAHFALSAMHHDPSGSGIHVHGTASSGVVSAGIDLGSAMLLAHGVATAAGIVAAVWFGPASRRLLAAITRTMSPATLPMWVSGLVSATDLIWNDLRDAVRVSGRAPPHCA